MANKQDINNLASLQEELKYTKLYKKKNVSDPNETSTQKAKSLLIQKYLRFRKMEAYRKEKAEKQVIKGTKNSGRKMSSAEIERIESMDKAIIQTIEFIESRVESKDELVKGDKKLLHLKENYSIDSYKNLKKKISSFIDIQNNKFMMKKELEIKKRKHAIQVKKIKVLKDNPKTLGSYAKQLRKAEILETQLRIRIKDLNEFIKVESVSRKIYLSDEPPLTAAGWAKLLLSYAFLLFWCIIILWPIYELCKATFNDASPTNTLNADTFSFGTESYSRLFNDTDYTTWLINTLIISVATSVVTVGFTLLMGYAFSRFRFKGKKMSLLSIMLLQMVPTLAALTVFYVMYTMLHESVNMDGRVVLAIIYIGGGIAGNTFIMKGYMDSISMEIDEAAKIDGLSQWRIFTRIITPLTKPMIALVALWSFIGPFGDYILPGLLLSESKDYTLAKGLQTLVSDSHNMDRPAFAAGAVITALPISILFISLRKFLVGGITAGGVKG